MSPPPGRVCPLAREGTSLTWKPGAPAGPCSPLSPAGPWGRGDVCGGAQGAPEPALRWLRVAVGGRGLADTHGWAGGTLGSSFTVFASGTLQERDKAGDSVPAPTRTQHCPPSGAAASSEGQRHRGPVTSLLSPCHLSPPLSPSSEPSPAPTARPSPAWGGPVLTTAPGGPGAPLSPGLPGSPWKQQRG